MIKDNSGYRASPRRIDALVANTPKPRRLSVEKKSPVKTPTTSTSNKQEKSPFKGSSPTSKIKLNPKLTKSTVKIKPPKSFYGRSAAQTPKGAKRRASDIKNTPMAKKARKSSPIKNKTPVKPTKNTSMEPSSSKRKLTKSTVKVKLPNAFYGRNAADTPKGARPNKRLASPIQRSAKKTKLSTPRGKFIVDPIRHFLEFEFISIFPHLERAHYSYNINLI